MTGWYAEDPRREPEPRDGDPCDVCGNYECTCDQEYDRWRDDHLDYLGATA